MLFEYELDQFRAPTEDLFVEVTLDGIILELLNLSTINSDHYVIDIPFDEFKSYTLSFATDNPEILNTPFNFKKLVVDHYYRSPHLLYRGRITPLGDQTFIGSDFSGLFVPGKIEFSYLYPFLRNLKNLRNDD